MSLSTKSSGAQIWALDDNERNNASQEGLTRLVDTAFDAVLSPLDASVEQRVFALKVAAQDNNLLKV